MKIAFYLVGPDVPASDAMSEGRVPLNPRGIFNRSSIGARLSPVEVEVERGRLQFFAEVLGETDPVYFDKDAALAAGYHDIVALPSFFTVLDSIANKARARRGEPSSSQIIGSDYRYLLHGMEEYEYSGLIHAGDVLTLTTTVIDFYDKKGGAMEFATLKSIATHPVRGALVCATRTLIHRLN